VNSEPDSAITYTSASLVSKVILYFPRWCFSGNIGDTVMISSLFKALKSVYPSSMLEVVSDEVVNATFYNDPYVDSFRLPTDEERKIPLRRHDFLGGPKQPREEQRLSWLHFRVAKSLIKTGLYEPLLCFHVMPQWKMALFRHLREPENLAELIRAPYKNILSLNFAVQTSEEIVDFPDLRPRIYLTEKEIQWARSKIGPNAIGVNMAQIRDAQKRDDGDQLRYKKASWKDFVDKVKKYDCSLRVYEIGQARFEGIGDEFLPNGSIRETAALVNAMRLVVLSDGGLHHICTAVDKEVLLFQAYEWNPPDLFKMSNAIFSESYHTACRKQCHIFSEILKVPNVKRRCSKACYELAPSALADDCIRFLKESATRPKRQATVAAKSLAINFVSHLHPFHYSGGGEQITNRLISEGFSRGHRIRIVAMKPDRGETMSMQRRHADPDLWILFDVFNCPGQKQFGRDFIDKIISSSRYIIGQNAYGDICYLNALPCNGNIGDGRACVENKDRYFGLRGNRSGWQDGYCPVDDNRKLFTIALLNVFLSPLHAGVFQ
jgi:ADP-heptose:LPS heptosyltransferase